MKRLHRSTFSFLRGISFPENGLKREIEDFGFKGVYPKGGIKNKGGSVPSPNCGLTISWFSSLPQYTNRVSWFSCLFHSKKELNKNMSYMTQAFHSTPERNPNQQVSTASNSWNWSMIRLLHHPSTWVLIVANTLKGRMINLLEIHPFYSTSNL